MISSVEEYLNRLRDELAAADPATIDNALADSEERLRRALESEPDLQTVIAEYGTPGEVAAKYRELEAGGRGPGDLAATAGGAGEKAPEKTYSAFWIVFGSIIAFFAFAFLMAGAGMLIVSGTLTDDDGYFMTDPIDVTRSSYAIITEPAEIDLSLARAFDMGLASLKGEVEAGDPDRSVFVGVAREDDLDEYLDDVAHDRITQFRMWSSELKYDPEPGDLPPAPPTEQAFWEQSAYGEDTQSLVWEPEAGTWVFVIMNEDGSPGIDVNAEIGARVPWLFGVGIGMLLGGLAGLTLGILLVIFAGVKKS